MEAQTAQSPSRCGRSSAAYPRWVMLEQYYNTNVGSSAAADPKTTVAARTSIGHLIQFSLHLAEPLVTPRVCIQFPDGADVVEYDKFKVVAAHGDSLLIHVEEETDEYCTTDYFVYNAGDAAADPPRPPSLSLLPPCHIFCPNDEDEDKEQEEEPFLDADATGLLRRGEDELVVAKLRTVKMKFKRTETMVAELCLFRSGEWSMRLPISYGDTGKVWPQLPTAWHTVGPVGDRQLCWVGLWDDALVICDVFEERPRLQYLRLPKDLCLGVPSRWNRNVCATASGGALKFVNIFPRCCCGAPASCDCKHSRHAYTIQTWTMRIGNGDMEWVKDGMVDASELWALDAYKGLPRVPLDHPVMSMYEPHVVYFQLCERHHVKYGGDKTKWLLKVDTRSKTIEPVSRREDGFSCNMDSLIPSNVLHFFNSYRSNGSDDGTLTGQRHRGIKTQQPVVGVDDEQLVREDDASNPTLQPSSLFAGPSEQASEFLEAFLEISRYGLGSDELKAYRILSQDNGRRFRSFLRLPKNMRKDWLLMEIKASSQAY